MGFYNMGWSSRPSNFKFTVTKDAEDLTKKIAIDTLQQVITRSPVDTGAYRNSHRVSLNSADNSQVPIGTSKSGSEALADGAAKIATLKLGGMLYVQNNLPYGMKLENGHSKQAPLGVYKLAFLSIVAKYGR